MAVFITVFGCAAPAGSTETFVFVYPNERPVQIGMFVEFLQYQPTERILQGSGPMYTSEDAIRIEGVELKDVPFGGPTMIWHSEPEHGFHCLYKPRDTVGVPAHDYSWPDGTPILGCDDLGQSISVDDAIDNEILLMGHASINFMYLDITNFPYLTARGDVQSLRPMERVAERIVALRAAGQHQPIKIAPWVTVPTNAEDAQCPPPGPSNVCDDLPFDHWNAQHGKGCECVGGDCASPGACRVRELMLDKAIQLMDDPRFINEDVFLEHNGKRVVFYADPVQSGHADAIIAQRTQQHNLVVVRLWHSNNRNETLGPDGAVRGSSCMTSPSSDEDTTLVFEDQPCNQLSTDSSPIGRIGVARSMSPRTMAGRPFTNSGKQSGYVLRKMLHTLIDSPNDYDYILVNNWAENSAAMTPFLYTTNRFGLAPMPGAIDLATTCPLPNPSASCAPSGLTNFHYSVDMWGHEFSRGIAPVIDPNTRTVDTTLYDGLKDCLILYRSGESCATAAHDFPTCCAPHPDPLHIVHSFRYPANGLWQHHVLFTDDDPQRDSLRNGRFSARIPYVPWAPPSYQNGAPKPHVPLLKEADPDSTSAPDGPFMTYRNPGSNRARLIRCHNGAGFYSFKTGSTCASGWSVDGELGYVSTVRTSAMPRPLRRCYYQGKHVPWLSESACQFGTTQHFGFVR